MASTKKMSESLEVEMKETIRARNKAKYRKRAVERIQGEMKKLSEEEGKPYRNINLARDLGMKDGSLISKWFNNDAEIQDYHFQRMAEIFHVEKSWLDGSGNARTHESYNSVIQKTGLSEAAIKLLVDKKEYDEMRDRDYHRRQELKADSPSDVVFLDGAWPIKTADVVSAIIESDHLDGIIRTIEKMVADQTDIFTALDDVADNDKQAELLRRNESAMQQNDYTAFLVTTYIKNILLDFVNKKAEERRTEK